MDREKLITYFMIPYLAICGLLYSIAYWDSFGVNGMSFISISSLLTSIVQPLFYSLFFSLFGIFLGTVLSHRVMATKSNATGLREHKKLTLKTFFLYLFLMIIWGIILYCIYIWDAKIKWFLFTYCLATPIAYLVPDDIIFKSKETHIGIKNFIEDFIIYLPFLCFGCGKENAERIINNYEFTYTYSINTTTNSIDTLKLIGITDKFIVLGTLDNSKLNLLRPESIDTISLYKYYNNGTK